MQRSKQTAAILLRLSQTNENTHYSIKGLSDFRGNRAELKTEKSLLMRKVTQHILRRRYGRQARQMSRF